MRIEGKKTNLTGEFLLFMLHNSIKTKAEVNSMTSAFVLEILLQALRRGNLTEEPPRAGTYDHIGQGCQTLTNNCYDVLHVFFLLSLSMTNTEKPTDSLQK